MHASTQALSRHQSAHSKKVLSTYVCGAICQGSVLKRFLYVFTQWLELMRKHVNFSLGYRISDSEVIMALHDHQPMQRATMD